METTVHTLASKALLLRRDPEPSTYFPDLDAPRSAESVLCILKLSPEFETLPQEDQTGLIDRYLKLWQGQEIQ